MISLKDYTSKDLLSPKFGQGCFIFSLKKGRLGASLPILGGKDLKGDYRVIYQIDGQKPPVIFLAIAHRSKIYEW